MLLTLGSNGAGAARRKGGDDSPGDAAVIFDRSIPGDVVMQFPDGGQFALVIATASPKADWLPRRLGVRLARRYTGTCVRYRERDFELVHLDHHRTRDGRIYRYYLRPWDPAELPRRVVEYSPETAAVEREIRAWKTRTTSLRPLLAVLSPLLGFLPAAVKTALERRAGFDPERATLVAAVLGSIAGPVGFLLVYFAPTFLALEWPSLARSLDLAGGLAGALLACFYLGADSFISLLQFAAERHRRGLALLEIPALLIAPPPPPPTVVLPPPPAFTEDGWDAAMISAPFLFGCLPGPIQARLDHHRQFPSVRASRQSAAVELLAGAAYALSGLVLVVAGSDPPSVLSLGLAILATVEGGLRLFLIRRLRRPVGLFLAKWIPWPQRLARGLPRPAPSESAPR